MFLVLKIRPCERLVEKDLRCRNPRETVVIRKKDKRQAIGGKATENKSMQFTPNSVDLYYLTILTG